MLWDDLLAGLEPEDDRKDALEGFKMADRNGDGKVSKDEFVILMSKSLDCNFFRYWNISSQLFCMNFYKRIFLRGFLLIFRLKRLPLKFYDESSDAITIF